MKNTTLKLLVWFCALLLLLGACGIAVGVFVGKKYYTLWQHHKELERQVVESKHKLERLSSLQALLQASNNGTMPVSRVKNEEIVAIPPETASVDEAPVAETDSASMVGSAEQAASSDGNATNAGPTQVSEQPSAQTPEPSGETGENGTTQANQTVAAPETAPGAVGATQTQNATVPAATVPTPVLEEIPLISSDKSPVRINNMSVKVVGQLRLSVNYGISSPHQLREAISGRVHYALIMNDGKRIEVRPPDYAESRFAILRMKPMETFLQLPTGVNSNARLVRAIELTVEIISDKRKFREVYPIKSLAE